MKHFPVIMLAAVFLSSSAVALAQPTEACVSDFDASADYFPDRLEVSYASGFDIAYFGNYKVITVTDPWVGAADPFEYVLVQCGTPVPDGYDGATIVEVPASTAVSMSSTYVAMFEELGLLDAVVGVDELDFIYSPALRERAEAGLITEIGGGNLVNVEAAIALDPDIIFSYGSGSSDYDAYPVLEQAGLIVALNGDYVEASPLGRSEWLKFIAAFFNAEEQANDLFSQIAEDYTALRDVVGAPEDRPTVMVNGLFGDTWYVAGGQSYIARLIADAGGDYLWADDPSTGGVPLSLEAVVERAQDADIWLNPNFWLSLADGLAEDERYAVFAPFESGNVFNNVAQITDLGGNNYYEAGTLHPERILADMIFIFHPELFPDHALNFYVRLR